MFTRPRSARWRSLHSGSLHITSLVFPFGFRLRCSTPLACRAAPAPAAAPARSSHTALRNARRLTDYSFFCETSHGKYYFLRIEAKDMKEKMDSNGLTNVQIYFIIAVVIMAIILIGAYFLRH